MNDDNFFNILERRNQGGFYPLNENHWSNILAWLLTRQSVRHPLLELLSPGAAKLNWTVEREIEYAVGTRKRRIDIHLTSNGGERLFIEVKIDPGYQDQEQIADQLSVLKPHERFVFVAPLDLTSNLSVIMTTTDGDVLTTAVTWRSIAEWCNDTLSKGNGLEPIERSILKEVATYWSQTVTTPFEQMVMTILEEQDWTAFYPDDFKEAFIRRFPEVWASWVAEKPSEGNGNPHQYLLTCLSMLANRKNGFRLIRTGQSRPPRPLDWGFPTIYELSLPTSGSLEKSI